MHLYNICIFERLAFDLLFFFFYQYDQFIGEQEINFADNFFLKLLRSLILPQQLIYIYIYVYIHEYFI